MSAELPSYIKKFDIDQDKLSDFFDNKETFGGSNISINTNEVTVENCFIAVTQYKKSISEGLVEQFYDTEFNHFKDEIIDTESDLEIDEQSVNDLLENQNQMENILENQLDELTKILELESQKNIKIQEEAEQNYLATKKLIIDMRIKNKEGTDESDFSDAFPFELKTNENADNFNPSPYVKEP